MNPLRTIPRAVIGGYLKVVTWPVRTGLRAVGLGARNGASSSAEVAVDRVDAAVRGAAGTALGDQDLKRDASRRGTAADERGRAVELRQEAEARRQEAQDQAAEREEAAEDAQTSDEETGPAGQNAQP